MRKLLVVGLITIGLGLPAARGQSVDSVAGKVTGFPGKLLARIQRKAGGLNGQLTNETESYLQKMQAREQKLQARLAVIDPAGAQALFAGSAERYAALEQQIRQDTGSRKQGLSGVYPAYLDSLQGTVKFLQQNPSLLSGAPRQAGGSGLSPQLQANLQGAGTQLQALQAKMGDASQVQAFLQQRKQLIGGYLAQHGLTTGPLSKLYGGMNQQVYYYSQELRQYKEMWTSPDQLTQKALAVLNRLPAFQTFMKSNSMLGGLFSVPGSYSAPQAISGLQTRAQVAALVQAQTGSGAGASGAPGSGAAGAEGSGGGAGGLSAGEAALQSNLQNAQSQLDNYKSKLSSLGTGNGDMDMPNFKPNDQKTKTFWKRLEYGADFQTTHTNYYFPMVTDFGASLGYKLGHQNVIGVGASYKLGWGNGIQHIAFSNQGVGLRSFLQIHLKSSFSATGGFEYNYTTPFASFQNLKLIQNWTRSGLIGVTKAVSLKNRVFKKTSVSLLWDFLSYQQVPQTQPFLFRIGYTF
jgi:hypothetical protein